MINYNLYHLRHNYKIQIKQTNRGILKKILLIFMLFLSYLSANNIDIDKSSNIDILSSSEIFIDYSKKLTIDKIIENEVSFQK